MAHPRMYNDDDPYLDDVRRVCLSFPEATEVEAWGRPTFRAGKRMFGVFEGADEHAFAFIFKADASERAALKEDQRFYVPPYYGPSGWLALDLTTAPVDWYEVRELAEGSYRLVALKRMLTALERRSAAGETRQD